MKKTIQDKGKKARSSHPKKRVRRKKVSKKIAKQRWLKQQKKQRRKRLAIEILVSIGITLVLATVVFFSFFRLIRNDGYGMSPSIQANDRLVVNKNADVDRFSIITFRVPNRQTELVRRIIGLPGEEIRYLDDELWVDGRQITERFLIEELQQAYRDGFQLTEDFTMRDLPGEYYTRIPEGYYLVLGDNRSFSLDSRTFGLVAATDITGVVEMVIYPWQRIGSI
ncbi:signal peptidase I [Enterococcus sp. LJL90]